MTAIAVVDSNLKVKTMATTINYKTIIFIQITAKEGCVCVCVCVCVYKASDDLNYKLDAAHCITKFYEIDIRVSTNIGKK